MEWTKYTTKEALKDNDELMILDTDGKANKRTLMDKIWDYVVDKMTTAVIAKLGTTNKTLIGAVNELNSNKPLYSRFLNNGNSAEKMTATIECEMYHDFIIYGTGGFFGTISTVNGATPIMYKNGLRDYIFEVNVVSSNSFEIVIDKYSRLSVLSTRKFTIK
ncbi:MAG: hypothetical protein ACLT50_05605 [Mediterraneibacter faecis]